MGERTPVIESLNTDLALEHGAIIQYLLHAVQLRDTPLAGRVMEMAREEMWHMDWLVEAIGERGGEATLDRADIFTHQSLIQSLERDTEVETRALEHYEITLGVIGEDDPSLASLVRRIMDDERHHRILFEALALDVSARGEEAVAATPLMDPAGVPVMVQGMQAKYQGLLQYLWCKYGCGDAEQGEKYFELAIDEMRHGHWLSDHLAGMGTPRPPEEVNALIARVADPAQALEQARINERLSRERFAAIGPHVTDPVILADLARIGFQRDYQREVLGRLGDA